MNAMSAEHQSGHRWARHAWNLETLEFRLNPPASYVERVATSADAVSLLDLILRAYGSDETWRAELPAIATRMGHRLRQTLGQSGSEYLVLDCDGDAVAVSGVTVSHWTDQNLLTGICVHPDHQRLGLGRFLLGRSLQWLQGRGVLHPQVYTEVDSLADRKIYPLWSSTRVADVVYPGSQQPPPGESYVVSNNKYFGGQVQSLGLATAHGYATVGVITPGRYDFSAEHEEHVLILSGSVRVRLQDRNWNEVPTDDAYIVPAGTKFQVESRTDVCYLCRYHPASISSTKPPR
jgi:uncharacterized protein YaiE (UPF0345 family)/N-acetylglutamate synthase-like GNAT family acetyltransferase